MGFVKQVAEYILKYMGPDDLQTLLDHPKIWKMFIEEGGLSRDEAKELYDSLKKFTAGQTTEDKRRIQEEIVCSKKLLEVFPMVRAEIESCTQQLRALAERVDKVHKDCTISNVVTSSAGATSGILSIFGLILAPFTAGGSLLLTAAGAGLGAATAVSSITTTAIENSDTSSAEAEAKRILSTTENRLKRLLGALDYLSQLFKYAMKCWTLVKKIKDLVRNIRAFRKALAHPFLALNAIRFITTGIPSAQGAQQVQQAFRGTPLSMTRAARIRGARLGALFLGWDVYNIVKDSQHLHEGAKAPLAKELRQKAQELEQELEDLRQFLLLCN